MPARSAVFSPARSRARASQVAVVARGAHLRAIRDRGFADRERSRPVHGARRRRGRSPRARNVRRRRLHVQSAPMGARCLPQFEAIAGGDATLVTLQNGLPFWYVRDPPLRSVDPGGTDRRAFPDERIVGGVVHVSGSIASPGRIVQSGGTAIRPWRSARRRDAARDGSSSMSFAAPVSPRKPMRTCARPSG